MRTQVPTRRCVACRTARPKAELLRLVASGGQAAPDPGQALPGRGCYLCLGEGGQACADKAAKAKAVSRALGGGVSQPAAAELRSWISAGLP